MRRGGAVLVTGAAGRLGSRVVEVLSARGHTPIPADVAEFDIADYGATRAWIAAAQPDFVIHPAAWTDVDGCAREPDKAITINGLGAGNVAAATADLGVYLTAVQGYFKDTHIKDEEPRWRTIAKALLAASVKDKS